MSHRILIQCDDPDCLKEFEERLVTSTSAARESAHMDGWQTTKSRPPRDYCPEHATRGKGNPA